ncbi:HEPN domain-containing protein [Streptomyces canus]|uniref:ApeA N-terminal domain 1-containing protein n=1 Tax=Streptomyces canus TaxID=58343 RepID=UPI0033EDD88F
MPDSTALKVLVPPDTYRCTWHIPTTDGNFTSLGGDLTLKRDLSPQGAILGEVPNIKKPTDPGGAGYPQDRKYPALRGDLENGRVATLLDCTVSAWKPDGAIIFARCALVGDDFLEEASFDRAKVQISNIDSAFGVSPIKGQKVPNLDDPYGSWSVEQNPESTQKWSDDDVSMTASYDASITAGDPYYFQMRYSPAVLIDVANPLTLDEFNSTWIHPLLNIAALSMNAPQRVTYLAVGMRAAGIGEQGWRKFQVYGTGITQEPFNSSYSGIRQNRSALNWKSDDISPLALLRRWQELNEGHHPLIETYGSFLNVRAQHPRARFLLLLQALEGLHGYENKEKEKERAERHLEKRGNILDSLGGCMALAKKEMKFLKDMLPKRPPTSLDSRLRDCFNAVPGKTLERLMEVEVIKGFEEDPANALRIMRNDLAHGNRGYPIEDLDSVARIVERATRAHFMRILGASESVQMRVFQES